MPNAISSDTLRAAIQTALDAAPERATQISWQQKQSLLALTDANQHFGQMYRNRPYCALEIACDAQHEPLALALMDHGFSWQSANPEHFNPVFSAAGFSRALLERLDAQGAPLETPAPRLVDGFPLHAAAGHACEPALRFLLERGSNPNIVSSVEDAGKAAPLHTLGHSGNSHKPEAALCARALVEFGADLSQRDRFAHTPLHWAYAEGAEILAEELIRLGSPWLTDSVGNTPSGLAEVYCGFAEEEGRAWPRNTETFFDPLAAEATLDRLAALPARVERDALANALPPSISAAETVAPGRRL